MKRAMSVHRILDIIGRNMGIANPTTNETMTWGLIDAKKRMATEKCRKLCKKGVEYENPEMYLCMVIQKN